MDESTVREHAQAHGDAVVAGDLRRASEDLTDQAKKEAPAVMGKMPKEVGSAEIQTVEVTGDEAVAVIRYAGEAGELVVTSRWAESDGRPRIVSLSAD